MPYLSWEPALVIFKSNGRSVEFEVDPEAGLTDVQIAQLMRDLLKPRLCYNQTDPLLVAQHASKGDPCRISYRESGECRLECPVIRVTGYLSNP